MLMFVLILPNRGTMQCMKGRWQTMLMCIMTSNIFNYCSAVNCEHIRRIVFVSVSWHFGFHCQCKQSLKRTSLAATRGPTWAYYLYNANAPYYYYSLFTKYWQDVLRT